MERVRDRTEDVLSLSVALSLSLPFVAVCCRVALSLLLLSLSLSWSLVVVVVVVVVAVVVVVVVAVGCGVVLCFERHFNVCVVHCVKEEESVAMSLQHRSPPSSQVTPSRAYRGGALESGNVSLVRRDEPACL